MNKSQEKKESLSVKSTASAEYPATSKLYTKLGGYAGTQIRIGDAELSGYAVFLPSEAPNKKSEGH